MRDYEKMSDGELLAALLEGDEAAFAEFTRRYRNPIINYIHRMLDDYDRAVDLAQETFLHVYMNAEQYRTQQNFATSIYRTAHNLSINELRRRKRRKS